MGISKALRFAFGMYCSEDRAKTSTCFWLGRELAKRGHDVTLIALSTKHRFRAERRTQDGVRLLLTPRGITGRWHYGGWGPHDIFTRLFHFVQEPYDVLGAFDCRPNVYLPFLWAKNRIPVRLMIWGDRWGDGGLAAGASRFAFQKRLEQKWEKQMALDADGIISGSKRLLELARLWGISDFRLCRLPHGSPTDLIGVMSKDRARERAGVDGQNPVIGYVGHTLEELHAFYPAFRSLIHSFPKMTILCIGACGQEDKTVIERAGLAQHFRFTGFVPSDEIGSLLACADCFLIPRSSNPVNDGYRYPGKLGDYMAAGRPIIVVDGGEAARVVREERIGIVLSQDLTDSEEHLGGLIRNRPWAEELGTRARRAAEEQFSWPILTDRFEAFLARLGSCGSRSA